MDAHPTHRDRKSNITKQSQVTVQAIACSKKATVSSDSTPGVKLKHLTYLLTYLEFELSLNNKYSCSTHNGRSNIVFCF